MATDEDEVDRIVGAWARERPDLDVAPLQVLSRVTRLARHLDLARRAAFAEHGLDTWEFDVLSALRRAGAPYALSPGRLVAQTLVTSGTMTNRIDRLEQRGLVSRSPDPSDRRGVVVSLTTTGQAQVDAAMADLLERERALLQRLDAARRADLAAALRALVGPFDSGSPAALPDSALPDSALPDSALPDSALPDSALPDSALPDSALPGSAQGHQAPVAQDGYDG